MKNLYKGLSCLFLFFTISTSINAQNLFFAKVNESSITVPANAKREIFPERFNTLTANTAQLRDFLWSLPSEKNVLASQAPIMQLPMPDGNMARFRVWESSLMEPGLAAKFPEMRTFAGQGIDDPYATIRFDYNPYFGFHAQILSVHGRVFIDPYAKYDVNHYMSYYGRDHKKATSFVCETTGEAQAPVENITTAACRGTQLYTFRLALACTGEYAVRVCLPNAPTVAVTAAAMLTSVNRVTGVYENELSVRMILVANNNNLIYLDGTTDPYTNNNGSAMLGQNQTTVDNIIGNANYDIGHVFSTGGGGVAGLGVVCLTGNKARGVTGSSNPIGDGFDIDYVAHEMGHQYDGNHSMAGCGSSPTNTKYEVGSGTTIQAYAGICGNENIQPNSDPYFHAISFDEISDYLAASGGCAVITSTGNILPIIDPLPNNNLTIPPSTPFTLTGTATDGNGDPLTYNWEQWDFSGTATWNAGATAAPGNTVPLFKSRIPKTTGSRTFPDIAVILAGYPANPPSAMGGLKGETLSPVARIMKFKLSVRDNRAGGGSSVSSGAGGCQSSTVFQVTVAGTTPFTVSVPNGGETWSTASTQTVTWDNAGTNVAPYNVTDVRITLSTDGGLTYPTTILASTPNDGSQSITVPSTPSTTARIRIEAVGNVFFDISNANFTIDGVTNPTFDFVQPGPASVTCGTVTTSAITLQTTSISGFTTPINLVATNVPAGTNITYSANPVTPGNSTVVTLNNVNTLAAGSYQVTITGTAGAETEAVVLTYNVTAGAGPTITAQPSPQTVCAGVSTTFSVTSATATGYQWQVNSGSGWGNVPAGAPYSGQTTSVLTINPVAVGLNGYQYRVIVSAQCGSTTSSEVLLTVQTAPSISAHPVNSTICLGTNTSFSVTASGTNLSYQWQVSTVGCGTFSNLANGAPYSGVTTSTLTITGATAGMTGLNYRVVVSGTCAPVANSNCGVLTVVTPPSITTAPANTAICNTGTTSFSVVAAGTGINYQWQVSTDGGTNWTTVNNGGVYSGATTSTLTITGANPTMNGYLYRAGVSNTTCTSPVYSSPGASLTVTAKPVVTLTASPYTKLLPGRTTTITAAVNPPVGFTTVWTRNGVPISVIGNSHIVNVNGLGVYTVVATIGTCVSDPVSITISDSASDKLFIFPSPNNGQFTVAYHNPGGATTQQGITIYDARGARVYNNAFTVAQPYVLHQMDLRRNGAGVYYVVLRDASGKSIKTGEVLVR